MDKSWSCEAYGISLGLDHIQKGIHWHKGGAEREGCWHQLLCGCSSLEQLGANVNVKIQLFGPLCVGVFCALWGAWL